MRADFFDSWVRGHGRSSFCQAVKVVQLNPLAGDRILLLTLIRLFLILAQYNIKSGSLMRLGKRELLSIHVKEAVFFV